jgi:hypothetical protein
LTSGCCAVSCTPAVWVWNRSICERGSAAPNSSAMIRAQRRRAARNFATSSSSVVRATKKKESRGANSSTASPEASAARTYSLAFASVKAISCTGVAPASAMWYPEMEMVFQRGISRRQYAKVSATSRSEGCGG